jgi:hypothetical protein
MTGDFTRATGCILLQHYEESLSGPLSSGASTDGVGEYDHADESDAPVVDIMQDEETFFWSVAFDVSRVHRDPLG